MRQLLASILLIACLGCAKVTPHVTTTHPAYLDAVRPMQVQVKEEGMSDMATKFLKAVGSEMTPNSFENICSMTAVRTDGVYLTAAHCVAEVGSEGRFVDEQKLEVIFVNYVTDIALLKADHVTPRAILKVSFEDLKYEQPVTIVGHPFGYQDVFVSKGWIASPYARYIDKVPFVLFNVTVAPGNSGSCVLNEDGEIVSILQIGWGREFSPMSGGATTENLKAIQPFLPQEGM